jgi:hypothetical protein
MTSSSAASSSSAAAAAAAAASHDDPYCHLYRKRKNVAIICFFWTVMNSNFSTSDSLVVSHPHCHGWKQRNTSDKLHLSSSSSLYYCSLLSSSSSTSTSTSMSKSMSPLVRTMKIGSHKLKNRRRRCLFAFPNIDEDLDPLTRQGVTNAESCTTTSRFCKSTKKLSTLPKYEKMVTTATKTTKKTVTTSSVFSSSKGRRPLVSLLNALQVSTVPFKETTRSRLKSSISSSLTGVEASAITTTSTQSQSPDRRNKRPPSEKNIRLNNSVTPISTSTTITTTCCMNSNAKLSADDDVNTNAMTTSSIATSMERSVYGITSLLLISYSAILWFNPPSIDQQFSSAELCWATTNAYIVTLIANTLRRNERIRLDEKKHHHHHNHDDISLPLMAKSKISSWNGITSNPVKTTKEDIVSELIKKSLSSFFASVVDINHWMMLNEKIKNNNIVRTKVPVRKSLPKANFVWILQTFHKDTSSKQKKKKISTLPLVTTARTTTSKTRTTTASVYRYPSTTRS